MEYLFREDAPLTEAEWTRLDEAVVAAAKQQLVGRRFIPVFGPFGVGLQVIHHDMLTGNTTTDVNMLGESEQSPLGTGDREHRRLPILFRDFQVHWRDIESNRQLNLPLDCTLAAAAATFVAHAEDTMIFHGMPEMQTPGLLTVTGRNTVPKGDFGQPGNIFGWVVTAVKELTNTGFYGPYALVLSPQLYALANRVYENTGVLEVQQIERLADAGVFRSTVLQDNQGVLVSTGPQNLDLAISQDLITAYLDTENMNHIFRVMEILTLRIKRPQAVCTIE